MHWLQLFLAVLAVMMIKESMSRVTAGQRYLGNI